jgi:hypothetical protein
MVFKGFLVMASSILAFNVTITNGNSNAAPADGFVDATKIEKYVTSLETTPSSLTLALCKAKRRANLRYIEIVNQLQRVANCYILPQSITATGGSATAEPSSFAFQMWAERSDALVTADESNPGAYLSGTAAITRCIARALTLDLFKQVDVIDPTSSDTFGVYGATTSVPRQWVRTLPDAANAILEVGPYANSLSSATALISVTTLP